MKCSDFRFGPWTTSLDSGSRLELSAFWKRRMATIADLPGASRRMGRRVILGALVAAALLAATPLVDFAPRDAAAQEAQPDAAAADEIDPAAHGRFVARFSNGVELELIGVSTSSADAKNWRGPDGLPLAAAPYKPIHVPRNIWDAPMLREICWQWRGVDEAEMQTSWGVDEATNGWGPVQPGDAEGHLIKDLTAYVIPFSEIRPTCTLRFSLSFPGSKWQAYSQGQGGHVSSHIQTPPGKEPTGVTFDKPRTIDGGTFVVMGYKFPADEEARLVAIDADGKRHVGEGEAAGNMMGFRQLAVEFRDLKPTEIDVWLVERRTRVGETVEFRNVSLDPQTPTGVQFGRIAGQASVERESPSEVQETAGPLVFGPTGEAVLGGKIHQQDYIDFDAGEILSPDSGELERSGLKWLEEHGVDAAGMVDFHVNGAVGFDLIAVRTEPESWDAVDQLPKHLQGATAGSHVPLDGGEPSSTYFFQTREGARGVLQIVEVIPDEAVKIRYKLAKPQEEAD